MAIFGARIGSCAPGSHLSIIPQYVWRQFKPGVVTPLPFDPLSRGAFGGSGAE